ncbi:hypothetical protein [Cohnella cholangitidis]|uniref:hypothetical protein n=1 Tax=Cohnella cholangitidis TaxID=2598458 RepID=UPI0015FB85B6|nr:hypothetical protein [Cohnella cholangitidis]
MEELLTLSLNFQEPIGVIVHGEPVIGIVEEMDDDRVNLSGAWYPIDEIAGVVS